MAAGRRVLCLYAGEALWHERALLAVADVLGYCWAIATPDGDIYVEDLRECESVRLVPSIGGRPQGLVGRLHVFSSVPTAATKAGWEREGARAVAQWKAAPGNRAEAWASLGGTGAPPAIASDET